MWPRGHSNSALSMDTRTALDATGGGNEISDLVRMTTIAK